MNGARGKRQDMPPIQVTVEFVVASGLALLLLTALVLTWLKARAQRKRFERIVSVDDEMVRLRTECDALDARKRSADEDLQRAADRVKDRQNDLAEQYEAATKDHQQRIGDLQKIYTGAKATYDRLLASVRELEEGLEHIDVGLYRPHFKFEDAESYKRATETCRDDVKRAIKQDSAIIWGAAWTVQGSTSEGERMQKQYGNVMLRAFNGECEAAIANVNWNNVTKMETRIEKAFAAINKLGTVMKVQLNSYFMGLRLKELRLVHEHATKKQAEAEEQRRIREQMREEERVQRELERAKQEADADERRYEKALARARDEAARATGGEMNELNERVRQLEQSLAEAHARGERAVSQAQLTKSGHVYVISNIGSFGADVVKIGMTRRIEPLERVKELGDASVPFGFDVHALIYSEDAPALEASLHRRFAGERINLVNERKEFFRTDLVSIASFAESIGLKAELTLVAEAQEYRETIAKRAETTKQPEQPPTSSFPAVLGSK